MSAAGEGIFGHPHDLLFNVVAHGAWLHSKTRPPCRGRADQGSISIVRANPVTDAPDTELSEPEVQSDPEKMGVGAQVERVIVRITAVVVIGLTRVDAGEEVLGLEAHILRDCPRGRGG